jgi:Domain of unknown function (DUF5047)
MYPVTDKFRRHLPGDHEVTTKVEAYPDPDADPIDISSYFEGGSITVAPQEIRRSGTITLVDGDGGLLPLTQSSPIAPYGAELQISHGLAYPDGTEELVPQGRFRIVQLPARYPTINLNIYDRAWIVRRALLEAPLTIPAGTLYVDAIRLLLTTAYPSIVLHVVDSEDVTPTIVLEDQADLLAEAQKMATAMGYVLYFDRIGEGHLEPEPDVAAAEAVWSYDDASNEFIPRADPHWSNLATYDQDIDWDTDNVYNAVIATGENTDNDTAFRGVAKDLDPTSPTYYGGKFGKAPMFYTSPLITSNQMAQKAAATRLQSILGLDEGLQFSAVPHPALDLGDPVLVVRRELGINQVHIIDGFTLPLRASGLQTIETRRRKVVLLA